MKHCAWKLLALTMALTMALAMLPSPFALTEDGMPELTIDGPIEIEGVIGGVDGDTQNQSGELEIVLDGSEGLPDLGADPGVGNLDLNLDLEAGSLELFGEALAPATNVDTPETVSTWAGLQAALNEDPKEDESTKPTQYQLVKNITDTEGSGPITVPAKRNVLLDLNNCTIDRNLSTATEDGCVIKVLGGLCVQSIDSVGGEPPMIKGGCNKGNGGGVYVADGGHFTVSNGIKISENKAKNGGGVYVDKGGEFTMTGGTISGNSAGAGVYVDKGGEFTMTGGTISGNDERGVSVVGGTFTMEKGTISGNSAGAGGGVFVTEDGTFTMDEGCEISGNTSSGSSGYGAGVHVVYGTFTMKGGTISNNSAGDCGGGVYVSSSKGDKKGKFTMKGGTISGNAAGDGGGVFVTEGGTFIMDDGCEISGNRATNGGGVQVAQGDAFTMYGGAISGNTATSYNGGVGVYGTFTMKGGTISNNSAGEHGGGVGLGDYGTIKLSGAVEISGNKTDGKDKNIVLISEPRNTNNIIVIEGTLRNQTPIGVSCGYEMTGPQVFTSGLHEYGAVGNFTSEQGGGYVILPVPQTISGAGEAVLYKRAKVTFDANGGKGTMEAQTVIQKWAWPLNANAFTWRGHSYSGWNTAADGSGTGYADGADIKLTGDIALYAQWTRHPITVAAIPGQTYSGAAIKPAPVVRDQTTGETLAEGVDYAVTYTDNVNVGTATATVTGKGDYAGKVNVQFTINRKILTVTADAKNKTYGDADPALTYTASGLVGGDALTGALSRATGENVGAYDITAGTLTAGDNYDLKYTGAKLTIGKKALAVTADEKRKTEGEADPTLTYRVTGLMGSDKLTGALTRAEGESAGSYEITIGTLSAGGNYTIQFTGAKLTIVAKETPKPTATPTVKPTTAPTATPTTKPTTAPTIEPTTAPTTAPTTKPTAAPKQLDSKSCKVTVKDQTYTGKPLEPAVTVKYGSVTLKKGTDYTVAYKNNVKPGKGTVTVTGKGSYTGSVQATFAIRVPLSMCKLAVKNQVYTGEAVKPAVTMKYGAKKLKVNTDYALTYKNNKAVGVATVTVTGKGGYTGKKTLSFRILPRATAIKLSDAVKGVAVKWTGRAEATGYQVQYGLKSSFKGARTHVVKGARTVSATLTSLEAGKQYYVRVRVYRKVGKKTYYSAWSKAESIKAK